MLLTRSALHFPFKKLGTMFWIPLGTVILSVFCLRPETLIAALNPMNLLRSTPSKSCARLEQTIIITVIPAGCKPLLYFYSAQSAVVPLRGPVSSLAVMV